MTLYDDRYAQLSLQRLRGLMSQRFLRHDVVLQNNYY